MVPVQCSEFLMRVGLHVVVDHDYHYTAAAILRVDGLWGWRTDCLGGDWNHLDVPLRVHRGSLSAVGEPGSTDDDLPWNCEGTFELWMQSILLMAYFVGCLFEGKRQIRTTYDARCVDELLRSVYRYLQNEYNERPSSSGALPPSSESHGSKSANQHTSLSTVTVILWRSDQMSVTSMNLSTTSRTDYRFTSTLRQDKHCQKVHLTTCSNACTLACIYFVQVMC